MNLIYYNTLPEFEHYFQPRTVTEAVTLLAQYGKEAKVLAGGTDLLILLRNRALAPGCIIDIKKIAGLDYIKPGEGVLRIGALATLREVAASPVVEREFFLLSEAVRQMATVQVRNMGTLVGNLCRAAPSADTATPLLALEARVEVAAPAGARTVPLDGFFTGPGATVLAPDELATGVEIPKLPSGSGTAFLRMTRVAADLAKVGVSAVLTLRGGICKDVRIALGAVAPTPVRAKRAEEALCGKVLEEGLIDLSARIAADEARPINDIRSTAKYRRELTKVLVRRAISLAAKRAQEGPEG